MRNVVAAALLLCVATSFGCAPTSPIGGFYTKTKVPADAVENSTGDKSGKSCITTILGAPGSGFLTFGDASVQTAAKNGGVSKVSSIDYQLTTVLFFYGQKCTVVTGK